MFGDVWRGRATRFGLLLTGLVAVLLAVASTSHAPDPHIIAAAESVSTSPDHAPTCHEAGSHDTTSVSSRTVRAVPDTDGPPVGLPAVETAATHQSVGPTAVHGRLVPTGGRRYLVLAQIART